METKFSGAVVGGGGGGGGGGETVVLAGHDWGANLVWCTAQSYATRALPPRRRHGCASLSVRARVRRPRGQDGRGNDTSVAYQLQFCDPA